MSKLALSFILTLLFRGQANKHMATAIGTSHSLTIWTFLRSLGLIYFIAFLSLSVQILGLFGKNGILPAAAFLNTVAANMGAERFWLLPTVFWLNSSDAALVVVCWAGILFSLLAIFGRYTSFCFVCLWFLYLSLATIGQDFLSFQWDALLLETGFLAIFLALKPSILFVWLTRWLLFRLMFESGLVKLASGDSTWRNLTALDFHYFTQPLPTPLAWFMAQAPHWFNALSVVFVFIIELVIPLLIFSGRKTRIIAAFILAAFQIIIAMTGNYAYFNLLTIILCISLLDDQFIKTLLVKFSFVKQPIWTNFVERVNNLSSPKDLNKGQKILAAAAATFIFCVSIGSLGRGFAELLPVPEFLEQLHSLVSPFFVANSYGLFAVMTTKRLEIIVEGSNDGLSWQTYEFKYKPGDLTQAPLIVAPHQPRLDWQMWFAALGEPANERWFVNFLFRLLQGQKEVLNLLAKNPFPESPPKYIRASLYDYHFTNTSEYARSGNWWKREFVRLCLPLLRLDKDCL